MPTLRCAKSLNKVIISVLKNNKFRIMGKFVLGFLLAAACLGATAKESGGEQLAHIGRNDLAWECRGAGYKTVLLVEDMGLDAHATFKNTFRKFDLPGCQICLYDRAGVGNSTPQSVARPYAQAHPNVSYEDVDAFNSTWDASQFELAKVSPDMRHVRMRYASHLFDGQDPWLVMDEIKLLTERIGGAAKPNTTNGGACHDPC